MTFDPRVAAILHERLDIGQFLDHCAALSFLERARFRMELLSITAALDNHELTTPAALQQLTGLHDRINNTAALTY